MGSIVGSNKSLTKKVQYSISISIIVKILAIVVSFFMMRISRKYLESDDIYGVWLTILSTVSWINLLDIGLGNGLRNKLSIEVVNENYNKSKQYISTTYALLLLISVLGSIITLVAIYFFDFRSVFNIKTVSLEYFNLFIFVIVLINFSIFTLNIIKSICYSLNYAFLPGIIDLSANILSIIVLLLLLIMNRKSLISIGSIYFGLNLLVLLVFTLVLFKTKFNNIKPSIKNIDLNKSSELMSTGAMFFFVQIGSMIIFTTDSLIISKFLGPSEVVPYQLIFKVYSIFTLASGIIMTPLWSAFTHAYTKGDYMWIKNIMKKLLLLLIPLIFGVIIVFLFRNIFIRIWMGESIIISTSLGFFMGISTIITIWSNIFAYFLNGINELKVQLITVGVGALINIPLSYLLSVTYKMGSTGVIVATIISLSIFAICGPIQVYNILKKQKNVLVY